MIYSNSLNIYCFCHSRFFGFAVLFLLLIPSLDANAWNQFLHSYDRYYNQMILIGSNKSPKPKELISSIDLVRSKWNSFKSKYVVTEEISEIDARISFLKFWTYFVMYDPEETYKIERDGFENKDVYRAYKQVPKSLIIEIESKLKDKWPEYRIGAFDSKDFDEKYWADALILVINQLTVLIEDLDAILDVGAISERSNLTTNP